MKGMKIVKASANMHTEEVGYWRAGAGVVAAVEMRVGAGVGTALAGGAVATRSRNATRALLLAHDGEYEWGRRQIESSEFMLLCYMCSLVVSRRFTGSSS